MKTEQHSGSDAYTSDIASSYEQDRKGEKLWDIEQSYVERAVRRMPAGSTLLDIPVGTGRFLPYYEHGKLKVLGIDISAAMIAEARTRAASPDIRLELGDASALAAPSESFDYVVCWRLLHLLPAEALEAVVRELSRVTARRLYLQAYVRDGWHPLLRAKSWVVRAANRLVSRSAPAPARWSHIQSYAHDERTLLCVFSACGLTLSAIDVLGSYGALRVKAYVLSRTGRPCS